MQPRSDTPHAQSTVHGGFGAGLLAALHESRRREVARAIYDHRHLIDDAKSVEMSHALARAQMKGTERRPSWATLAVRHMRAWTQAAQVQASR